MKSFKRTLVILMTLALIASLVIVPASADGIDSYAELNSAITAASNGDTITIGGDIADFSAPIIIEGQKLTIDLNGNDISISADIGEEEAMFELLDGADVTFTDSSSSAGTIDMSAIDTACSAFFVDEGSSLTLEKINVNANQSGYDLIRALDGDVTINSGTYKITYGYFITDDYYIDEDVVNLTINAGTFTGYESDVNNNSYCASFISLHNANVVIEDCTASGIDDGVIVCGGSLTVNGGSITAEDSGIYVEEIDYPDEELFVPMKAEINDCTVAAKYFEALGSYGGDVTINGGTFTSELSKVVLVGNDENFTKGNKFVINGGTFTTVAPQSHDDHFHYNEVAIVTFAYEPYQGHTCTPREVIINGGTFKAAYAPAGQFRSDITINGGTFEGLSAGIVIDNYDEEYTFVIKGGTFTARERTTDDETKCPVDDFLGETSGIFGVNIDILDIIPEGYSLYAEGKTVTKTISADYEEEQKAYYTEENTLAVEKTEGSILDGKDAVIYKGKETDTLFKSDISFNWFVEVKVDGKVVDPSNYEAKSGSTDITLKASYLKTLSLGKHTLEISSNVLGTKLVAKTTFTIANPPVEEKEEVANTGDNTAIGAFVALGTIAAAGFVSLKKKEN